MRTTTSDRLALALAAVALLSGCERDFCVPADGSRSTLFVNPPEYGRNGTTDRHLFGTIQEALDSASADVPTTVCVASGTYYEELTIRGNTRLLGEATGDVLIRPPQTRLTALPSAVDRTMLTVHSADGQPISIRRVDIGGAAICADVSGDGAVTFDDTRLTGCGLGLRATGGTLTVRSTPIKDHGLQGVLLTDMARADFIDGELFGDGGVVDPGDGVEGYAQAPTLSGVGLGGALIASGVTDLRLRGMLVHGRAWTDALISVTGGTLSVTDTRIDLLGLARGGHTPAFQTSNANVALDRVTLDGQGHGLLHAAGTDRTVTISNLSWRDDQPLEDPDAPGARPAIVQLDLSSSDPLDPIGTGTGQSALELRHVSVNASAPTVVIGVGADDLRLLAFNSVFWGVGDGNVIDGPATLGLGFGNVLTDDTTLTGDNIIDPNHVDFFAPGFGATRYNVPASDGPLRCKGANLTNQAVDLLGNPRPYDDGQGTFKLPDLGAIELQEPCP